MRQTQTGKKRLRWWQTVLIVLLVLIIGFLGFSYGMIRHFVGDSLSFKGMLSMAGYGGFDMPDWFTNYVLDVDRSYPGLPELLVDEKGNKVQTPEQYAVYREELLDLYQTYMFGGMPAEGFETTFTVEESGPALEGAALRRQVRVTTRTEAGTHDAMLLLYTPANVEQCGVFIGLNFSGNTAIWADEAVLPSCAQEPEVTERGQEGWPVDDIIAAGYGVATMHYGDWAEDNKDTFREGILSLFPKQDYTAFTAWAFGLMRGVDYLVQQPDINSQAIASVGHSRLARVSLWAGANDERIALVTASCGGGLMRSPLAARIDSSSSSVHWNTEAYFSYEGNDEALPVDAHMLYALIADRHLYVSIGAMDLASDPVSTYDALQNAKQIWQTVFGRQVIPDGSYEELPSGHPVFSESVAVHVHSGGHAMTAEDWQNYIGYMTTYVCS